MLMKRHRLAIFSILFLLTGCGEPSAVELHDGDIIFQTSLSDQSLAIQTATHSKYSHMGMIFFQDGEPYVFEALQTVQFTPLQPWIERGEGEHYVIKRLRDADRLITDGTIENLKAAAARFQGKPYDVAFEWSDERVYCSELVWKIYERGLGVRIGQPKKLREFDLSDGGVKKKLRERYGDQIPLIETVISPGDMFSSELLVTVK